MLYDFAACAVSLDRREWPCVRPVQTARVVVRQDVSDVWNPDTTIKSAGEHALPEGELQFGYDLPCGRVHAANTIELLSRIECGPTRVRQTQEECVVPWPVGTVDHLERF